MADNKEHVEHHEVKHTETTVHEHTPGRLNGSNFVSQYGKLLGGILLFLIVAGGLIYWQVQRKDTDKKANLDEIRDAFPKVTENSGSFFGKTATSTPQGGSSPATSTPPTNPNPAPSVPVDKNRTSPRGQAAVRGSVSGAYTAPAPTSFRDSSLGLEFTIPANWTTDYAQNSANKALLFNRSTGGMVGYVSVYQISSAETLDTLEQTIRGSADAATVVRTTAAGRDAIYYTTRSGQKTVAILHGGRVYYFHDAMSSSAVLNSLKFI
jgi:hypothetical protein